MKYISFVLCLVFFSNCVKKDEKHESTTVTATTTTGAVPTPTVISNTAEFEVNSTDYNYGFASVKFYNSDRSTFTVDGVKLNGQVMAMGPNDYRSSLASSTYTSAVSYDISSSNSLIPDTGFMSPPIPKIGFQKDITRTYDKTLAFTITVDASGCDSLFFTLGEVVKRIPGKTGINSITFYPADKVKYSITDSTQVNVKVLTVNYNLFTVRAKRWRSISTMSSLSFYKYK